MQKSERRSIILEKIKELDFVTTKELFHFAEEQGMSNITVRRDLKELEQEGYLKLSYGAITLVEKENADEKSWNEKINFNVEEKTKIARFVNEHLLTNEEVIFVSAGTTCEILVRNISRKVKLLVTNSFEVFRIAMNNPNIKDLMLLGGMFRRRSRCFLSNWSNEQIAEMSFSSAFFSANNVNESLTIFNSNQFEAQTINSALKKANRKMALVDHSKFNSYGISTIARQDEYDYLITDKHEVTEQLTVPSTMHLYLV